MMRSPRGRKDSGECGRCGRSAACEGIEGGEPILVQSEILQGREDLRVGGAFGKGAGEAIGEHDPDAGARGLRAALRNLGGESRQALLLFGELALNGLGGLSDPALERLGVVGNLALQRFDRSRRRLRPFLQSIVQGGQAALQIRNRLAVVGGRRGGSGRRRQRTAEGLLGARRATLRQLLGRFDALSERLLRRLEGGQPPFQRLKCLLGGEGSDLLLQLGHARIGRSRRGWSRYRRGSGRLPGLHGPDRPGADHSAEEAGSEQGTEPGRAASLPGRRLGRDGSGHGLIGRRGGGFPRKRLGCRRIACDPVFRSACRSLRPWHGLDGGPVRCAELGLRTDILRRLRACRGRVDDRRLQVDGRRLAGAILAARRAVGLV